jgi:hypothetical protein
LFLINLHWVHGEEVWLRYIKGRVFEVSYRLAVPDWASKKNGVTAIQAAVRLRLYDRVSAHVTPIAMSDQNGWFKGLNVVCKSFG